jgi:hypothetical protein
VTRRRTVLRGLLVAVVADLHQQVPATADAQPTPDPIPGQPRQPKGRVTVRPMTVLISSAPQPLNVGQQRHSAFPGIAQLPDGAVHLVWREGSDHVQSRDGVIRRAVSTDGGRTFGPVTLLRADEEDRDPSLAVIDAGNGPALYMTWFLASATAPARGAYVMREFGATYRMDPNLPYAATTAPVVRLPNGQIGGVFYGRQPGENINTVFMAWSNDGGPWTSNRIANAIGAGIPYSEPWAVVDGVWTHVFFRDGADGIAMRSSSNSGATGSWNEPHRILNDATGRPVTIRTAAGTLVMVYRQASTGAARIAFSADHGVTWQDGGLLLSSVGGIGMTYAAMFEPLGEPGVIRGVVGRENANGTSQLYGFSLVER